MLMFTAGFLTCIGLFVVTAIVAAARDRKRNHVVIMCQNASEEPTSEVEADESWKTN